MSYKYNNVDITSFIYCIKDINAYNAYNNSNITLNNNYLSDFSSSIQETLTETIGYSYNNVDISQYCIAKFYESQNTQTISIPSWCKKLRVLLIGGGGGGGSSQMSSYYAGYYYAGYYYAGYYYAGYYYAGVQQCNYYLIGQAKGNKRYQNDYFNQAAVYSASNYSASNYSASNYSAPSNNTLLGGGGGGGGGFIYLPSLNVISTDIINITVGDGGISGVNGNSTILTLNSVNIATASGGIAGSSVNSGNGGTNTVQSSLINITNSGNSGSNSLNSTGGTKGLSGVISFSNNENILRHGSGGNGAIATQGSIVSGYSGNKGYYRIYFLSN